jgi:ABC-type Fe3+-hydroxamate transport system substrate-binding protein
MCNISSSPIGYGSSEVGVGGTVLRIVSFLPSATEIVYARGLGSELVGVSHECDFPSEAKEKPKMIEPAFDTERGQPSTYIEWDSVLNYDPEVIVLMPCGFTASKTMEQARYFFEHSGVNRLSAVQNGRVYATDGHNYFSRSGPRLFDGIRILAQVIHPEIFNEQPDPLVASRAELIQTDL